MGDQPRAESRVLTQALPNSVYCFELPLRPWHTRFGPFDPKKKFVPQCSLPLHNLVSDSAHPHDVSDPLPQSFVGSS